MLDHAFSLAKSNKIHEALTMCYALMNDNPKEKTKVLRTRSHIYLYTNDINNALNDRLEILCRDDKVISDYYFAGEIYVELKLYKESIPILKEAVCLSTMSDDNRYLDAAKFLLSFSLAKLKMFKDSILELSDIDDDFDLWIEGHGLYSKSSLMAILINPAAK